MLNNTHDDWRAKRCGHNYDIDDCPYESCEARDRGPREVQEAVERERARFRSHLNIFILGAQAGELRARAKALEDFRDAVDEIWKVGE